MLRRAAARPAAGRGSDRAGGEGVRVGRASLDLAARRLFDAAGGEIAVTGMEFDLLEVLALRPNRVLSRDQLLDLAHNDSWEPFDRSIDIRTARLRKKVEPDPAAIKTPARRNWTGDRLGRPRTLRVR